MYQKNQTPVQKMALRPSKPSGCQVQEKQGASTQIKEGRKPKAVAGREVEDRIWQAVRGERLWW
jgi:hypothetical protein